MGRAAIAHFTTPTSSGTFDITNTDLDGMTPKAALFFVGRAYGSSGGSSGEASMGIGACDAVAQWVCCQISENGVSSTDDNRDWNTSNCLRIINHSGGSIDGTAAFDSFITNGVRLDCTNAFGQAYNGFALLIAGDDVQVDVGSDSLPAASSTTSITAPGFEPDWGIFACAGTGSGDTIPGPWFTYSQGMAENTGAGVNQYVMGVSEADNDAAGNPGGRYNNDRLVGSIGAGGTSWLHHSVMDSWDANGFTLSGNSNPGNDEFGWLVVKGGFDFSVDQWQLPTSTGNQSFPDPGFTPDVRFSFYSSMDSIDTGEGADSGSMGIIVTSTSEQGNVGFEIEDASDPTDCETRWSRAAAGGTYDYDVHTHSHGTLLHADHVDMDTWNLTHANKAGYAIMLSLKNITDTPIHERGHLTPALRGLGGFGKSPLFKSMQGFNS